MESVQSYLRDNGLLNPRFDIYGRYRRDLLRGLEPIHPST